mgnify:CR=1 FL=1
MKQALIQKITPIIESFVDDILKSFNDIEKTRQELVQTEGNYRDLIIRRDKELADIKRQKAEDKETLDRKITELELAKQEHVRKAEGCGAFRAEMDAKIISTDDNLFKSKIELARVKDVRLQAEKTKEEAEKLKKDYALKLESLKTDFDKNEKDKKEAAAEKVKLAARENENYRTENRQNEKAKELNDQELKIKVERKEIDRLIKRYNLEESLKG